MMRLISLIAATLFTFSPVVFAATYDMPPPGEDIVGKTFTVMVKKGDNFLAIGHKYGIGAHELLEANPDIHPDKLKIGQKIIIPAAYILPSIREGIVINIPELRLYYFTPDHKKVITYYVGMGRRFWRTPTMRSTVYRKTTYPTWHVPQSIREYTLVKKGRLLPAKIPGGVPDNPLGSRALYLAKKGYLIHGTNQPQLVGRLISSGCIRMRNEDVEHLYEIVPKGTPVSIVHLPYKVGWHDGHLYLEVHRPVGHDEGLYASDSNSLDTAITSILSNHSTKHTVNWSLAKQIEHEERGIPYQIDS